MMEVVLECFFVGVIVFASIIPHELAHILTLKYYGVDVHLKFEREERDAEGSGFP